jgi:hypothetical protein
MASPGKMVSVQVQAAPAFQTMDGFGVNINSKLFGSSLLPALDLLVHDLGATLYRVDFFGKSNWPDPAGVMDAASALDPAHLADIYHGEVARCGWEMIRYLNALGIEPYLTASGDVPRWMLAADGRTLDNYEAFAEMLVSLLDWAINSQGLRIRCFGPLNETDIGTPEGPAVNPVEYGRVLEILADRLERQGLAIPLVVAEQGNFGPQYIREIFKKPKLARRVGIFGLHTYADLPIETYRQVVEETRASAFASSCLWMTEYGDLDQSGEKEWFVAWAMTSRLLDFLEAGFQAGLVWDAFDNYHDHDEHWTIYGLLRTGLRAYTPKKRYYASKQIFRFVLPGFERLPVNDAGEALRLLGFANPERSALTLVGMNPTGENLNLNIALKGFPDALMLRKFYYYRTSESENCHCIGEIPVRGGNWPFTGLDVWLPPYSIFTLTSVE